MRMYISHSPCIQTPSLFSYLQNLLLLQFLSPCIAKLFLFPRSFNISVHRCSNIFHFKKINPFLDFISPSGHAPFSSSFSKSYLCFLFSLFLPWSLLSPHQPDCHHYNSTETSLMKVTVAKVTICSCLPRTVPVYMYGVGRIINNFKKSWFGL